MIDLLVYYAKGCVYKKNLYISYKVTNITIWIFPHNNTLDLFFGYSARYGAISGKEHSYPSCLDIGQENSNVNDGDLAKKVKVFWYK